MPDPDGAAQPGPVGAVKTGEGYGLSPMQKGMLFHQLFEPDSGADIEQMVMRFSEDLDVAAIAASFEAAASRHEVLRTSFQPVTDGEPTQTVQPSAPMELVEVDQRAYSEEQADERLGRFLADDRTRGFDPEQAPLSRLAVFHRGPGSAVLVWTFHHIILDGRSFSIVLADVFSAYDAIRAGRTPELEPSIPYRRFIDRLNRFDSEAAARYWGKTLAGFTAPTPLGIDGIGRVEPTGSGFAEVTRFLEAETTRALEQTADAVGVTLNTMLQAAWARLLSIYSGESDVVFGATRSGRYGTIDGADTIAGLFINTLPMRIAVPPDADVASWLQSVRSQHLALRDHEHTPLVDVQGWSEIRSGRRLFDTILVFERERTNTVMKQRTGVGDRVDFELLEQTNHPILLSAYGGTELEMRLEYDRSMVDPQVADRMVGHLVNVLRSISAGTDGVVGDLRAIGPDEAELVIDGWSPAPDRSTAEQSMVDRWRNRVASTPDAVAVADGDDRLTYAELDARAAGIATALRNRGVGSGHVVGILLDRSPDALAAMLATLQAGAAYLPLDPSYPGDRLGHMVSDSGASVVIVHGRAEPTDGSQALLATEPATIDLDALDPAPPSANDPAPPSANDPAPPSANDPAYIIYTSGSTGTPKGVVVPHGALVNHADGVIDAYGLSATDAVLQFAALSFDVAAEELYPTWLAGGTVVLRTPTAASNFDELHRIVHEHDVSVLNLPAAYWATWVDHLIAEGTVTEGGGVPEPIRLVVTGSDKVPTAHFERWRELAGPRVDWLNAYGPTEATITATVFDPAGADPAPGAVMPIGRPIANTVVRIVDEQGRPTPIGVAGELLIGGRGLAIGYHERPELTAERFVEDPAGRPGDRVYRSGDLARWLPDGNIEFLGRADDQVKVRGFRIELGEIETAMTEQDGVAQAAVVARPDAAGNNQLIGFIVADDTAATGPADTEKLAGLVKTGLTQRLPGYMVPVAIATTDALPLSPSGKIDRKALPDIEVAAPVRRRVEPGTELERRLATIWSDVLGTDDVSVHDNFFDAGGNSLSAIRLFSAIKGLTGERLGLPELFAAPSIAELALLLEKGGQTAAADGHNTGLPSYVFPVKASGSRPPLFHLGGASVIRELARHIDPEVPLYALLEQDLDADHLMTSVDEIVPHCIAGIKAVQPTGPYHVAGLCFGGVVALEMSRRLRADGEDVALTIMIDSFAPGIADVRANLEGPAGAVGVDATEDDTDDRHDRPDTDASAEGSDGPGARSRSDLRRKLKPARLVRKAQLLAWRAAWGPLHQTFRRTGRRLPEWMRDVEEANTIAADGYRASPYDGDVTLLRATGNVAELEAGPTNGWDAHINGELYIDDVDGGHISMYREPNVRILADKLNDRLEAARSISAGSKRG